MIKSPKFITNNTNKEFQIVNNYINTSAWVNWSSTGDGLTSNDYTTKSIVLGVYEDNSSLLGENTSIIEPAMIKTYDIIFDAEIYE